MSKVTGKDLEFFWNGQEEPVENVKHSENFGTEEGTDTATPGDGKDYEVIRADRSFTAEQYLYTPDGAEITSGTLTAGSRYRVTNGTITEDEGGNIYTVGMIFESDGTGTASSTNRVKALGTKVTGKDMSFSFNATTVPVTDADISISYDELDATDTSSTGDSSETEVSRADRESKISVIMRSDAADLLTTNPAPQACILTLATGQTITGTAIPISKEIVNEVKGLVKIDYAFKWRGTPTEVAAGLATAVEKAFIIIHKRGTSTNKQYSGNAIITQKTITATIKGITKISYTFRINGAVTSAVAN